MRAQARNSPDKWKPAWQTHHVLLREENRYLHLVYGYLRDVPYRELEFNTTRPLDVEKFLATLGHVLFPVTFNMHGVARRDWYAGVMADHDKRVRAWFDVPPTPVRVLLQQRAREAAHFAKQAARANARAKYERERKIRETLAEGAEDREQAERVRVDATAGAPGNPVGAPETVEATPMASQAPAGGWAAGGPGR
jgi:hypothetical protein